MPRAVVIEGAGAGADAGGGADAGAGTGAGAGAGAGTGAKASADVPAAVVGDEPPPPPPQAATPALRKAIATRRTWDMVFSTGGIRFFLDKIFFWQMLSRQDSVVVVKPSARHEHPAVDAGVGADARYTAVTMRVAVDADPVRAPVRRRRTGCSMPWHAGATGRRGRDRRVDEQLRVASSSCHRTCRAKTARCCLGWSPMQTARTGPQERGNPPICCISPSRSGCPTSETIFPVESR